jgi:hypothetical protein
MPYDDSIKRARAEIKSHLVVGDPGTRCPCCARLCRLYPRKLNSGIARSLIWLVKSYEDYPRWIDVPAEGTKVVTRSRELGKLVHWGLILRRPNDNPRKKTSGLWKPTQAGIDFVYDRVTVVSHVYLTYDNILRGYSKKQISIQDALGQHFHYQELMNSWPP